jgi:hypothetical protein
MDLFWCPIAQAWKAANSNLRLRIVARVSDFADAISPLPRDSNPYPDKMCTTKVVEVGTLSGGIAGFHHLYVKVERGGR